ncbi:type I polyketide synthase [Nocardia suismassiliense]|uniref:type I polyketide synthase n=1 Tax=Nocardia suismassiliense TaxID=2077092 RepID=UPI000D1F23EC|nr:type I polyketide synthase [Nocardia suismassiliense]
MTSALDGPHTAVEQGHIVVQFPGLGGYAPGVVGRLVSDAPSLGAILGEVDRAAAAYRLGPVSVPLLASDGPALDELADSPLLHLAPFAASCVLLQALRDKGLDDAIFLGHSTGELTALVAAGALSIADATGVLCAREVALIEAGVPGDLLVMQTDTAHTAQLCGASGGASLAIAVSNSPEQTVVSGTDPQLDRLAEVARAAGVQATRLFVHYPHHNRLLARAARQAARATAAYHVTDPTARVYSPILGRFVENAADARRVIDRQLIDPVDYLSAVRALHHLGVRRFVEVGVRSVLTESARRALPADAAVCGPPPNAAEIVDVLAQGVGSKPHPPRRHHDHGVHPDQPGTVAIVGIGIGAPGVNGPEDFWRILHSPTNALCLPEHIDLTHWFSSDRSAPDKTYAGVAGFLRGFAPHHRLAEEQSRGRWDGADETTVLLRHSLLQAMDSVVIAAQDRCGAYIGAQPGGLALEDAILLGTAMDALGSPSDDDNRLLRKHYRHAPAQTAEAFPDRMVRAACQDLLPANSDVLVIDTACSSSLYTIDLGVKSLLAGERDVVFCGGAITGSRRDLVLFAKLQGLAPNGEIRAFDRGAAGVLFSDSSAVVALKLLDRARADGDEILGLLSGFGGATDGQGSLVATSQVGQRLALERAHTVDPTAAGAVEWIVAHGTGTVLGDDVELETLADVPGSGQLWCTSNKPLIGHGAWAAGAINVIHAVLAMRHGEIPAEQYFTAPRDDVRSGRVTVPVAPVPWPARPDRRRVAGVCAYGLGGTNAHLLVQAPDPGFDPPQSARPPAAGPHDDPMVLVGTAVQFPGEASDARIRRWLRGDESAPALSFGAEYPLPPFKQLRMPPVSARSIDRTHLMALAAVDNFVDEAGELWDEMRDRTGVFTAHTGPSRCMAEYTVRAGADDLRAALPQTTGDRRRLEDELAALCARLPEANDASMTGQLTNIISATVVNRHRLNGAAMNIDCGRSSTQGALHVAERYLCSGELDFALVLGIHGNSTSQMAELSGITTEDLGEAAVLLALTRRSVATRNGWPVRAVVRTDATRSGQHSGLAAARGRCYFGAEGALAVLRALDGRTGSVSLRNTDSAPHVEIEPLPHPGTRAPVPDRSVVVWRRHDPHPDGVRRPAIEPATLILTHRADLARQLEPLARAADSWVLCTDPVAVESDRITVANGAGPHTTIESAVMGGDLEHVLIIASVRTPQASWPAPPSSELLALQEYALAATAALGECPDRDSTIRALLLDPLHRSVIHPHLTLITGFQRGLAHEIPNPVYAIVTDAELGSGLDQLSTESAQPRDRTVVYYRQGLRYLEQLCPAPLPAARQAGPLPLPDNPVIVATGGARGATAVVVKALADRVHPSVWLLGTTAIADLPEDLIAAADHELIRLRAEFLSRERELDPAATIIALNKRFDAALRGREIHRTLRELERTCGVGNVHYLICDLRDREQVIRAAKSVYARHSRVDLLIHGAGRIRSVATAHKSLADFQEIRDIKVAGYHHLKEAFADPAPALWCNFGSATALMGCAGDTDYVAANEYLCAAAAYGADDTEFTPAWGLWTETGMVAHLAGQLSRELGLTGIDNEHGADLMLAELATPRPLDAVPMYGLANSWPQQHDPVEALLGDSDSPGVWTWRPDSVRDAYLGEHLIDRRPVLPAVMMLALAAEAALRRHPASHVTAMRQVQIEAPVYTDVPAAACRITTERVVPGTIRVELRSDVVTPDGRILVRDRLHCRVDVDVAVGALPSAPPAAPTSVMPALAEDPAVRPDVSAQLSGVWKTMHQPAADHAGARARCRPHPEPHSVFAQLRIPVLLLDSTLRLFGYPPQPDGRQIMAVPIAAERIDFYTNDTDVVLAERLPAGIDLSYNATEHRAIAAAHGHVLLAVTGLTIRTVTTVPAEIPYQEWRP